MKISEDFIVIEDDRQLTLDKLKTICHFTEKMPYGFFVQKRNGEMLFVNNKLVKMFGCSDKDELLKMLENNELNLVHPEDWDSIGASTKIQYANNPDSTIKTTYRMLTKDNEMRWVQNYCIMIDIECVGEASMVSILDVTDAKVNKYNRMDLNGSTNEGISQASDGSGQVQETDTVGALSGLRILMVEDNARMRELSKDLLEEAGAEVVEADNGQSAVDLVLSNEHFDAILMDVVMPVMDGIEATKLIGKYHIRNHMDVPIIILTSEGSNEQVETCIRAGAYDYMKKPFSIMNFSRIMIAYMRKQSDILEKRLRDTILSSRVDPLTGFGNSSAYTAKVAEIVEEMNRNQFMELGVLVCDINNLKEENDTYGHAAGDMYIRNCCNVIRKAFDDCTMYRVGGDEFVVILEGDACRSADTRMIHLENAMLAASVIPETCDGKANFASGLAIYDRQIDKRYSDVVKRADIAMYENKRFLKNNSL